MNCGKVSESIYNRTVYKTIQTTGYHDIEKTNGAGLGADCAILASGEYHIIQAQGTAFGRDVFIAARAVIDALNRIAAYGVDLRPERSSDTKVQISLQISMAQNMREAKLRAMLSYLAEMRATLKMPIAQVDAQVLPQLDHEAVATAFVVVNTKEKILMQGKAKPEQDVVMTKWMALEGTALLAHRKKDELTTRYPLNLVEEAMNYDKYLSIIPEAATAAKSDVSAMQVVRDGGIFGGLWQLAEKNGVGLVIDLKKIAVKQETIEVCEFFDSNPYKLISGGSLLLATEKGAHLVSKLEAEGIPAKIIGRTTANNDRIVENEEETRFLEPVREDEIYQVLYKEA